MSARPSSRSACTTRSSSKVRGHGGLGLEGWGWGPSLSCLSSPYTWFCFLLAIPVLLVLLSRCSCPALPAFPLFPTLIPSGSVSPEGSPWPPLWSPAGFQLWLLLREPWGLGAPSTPVGPQGSLGAEVPSPHPFASTVGSNKCRVNNGGCSSLCLATPRGRQCACAEDQILGSDSVTCQGRLGPSWGPPFPTGSCTWSPA